MGGPGAILWRDIEAFDRLSGLRLAPWEIEVIEACDAAFHAECAKSLKSSKSADAGKPGA